MMQVLFRIQELLLQILQQMSQVEQLCHLILYRVQLVGQKLMEHQELLI